MELLAPLPSQGSGFAGLLAAAFRGLHTAETIDVVASQVAEAFPDMRGFAIRRLGRMKQFHLFHTLA
jgi:hypothetical protein